MFHNFNGNRTTSRMFACFAASLALSTTIPKALEAAGELRHAVLLAIAPAPNPEVLVARVDPEEARRASISEYLASTYAIPSFQARSYVDTAWVEAEKHPDVTPELLIAVMRKESSLQAHAQSGYGAEGLMQVVSRFHREKLARGESLIEPKVNIRVGAEILQEYLTQSKGNMRRALAKYSGNAHNYASQVLSNKRQLEAI